MKAFRYVLLLALIAFAAAVEVAQGTEAAQAVDAPVVEAVPEIDYDAKIREYFKLQRHVSAFDAAAAAAPADATATPTSTKAAIKIEKQRGLLLHLENELTAAGFDLAAIAADRAAQAEYDAKKNELQLDFLKAWNAKLAAEGRPLEPEFTLVNGRKVKTPEDRAKSVKDSRVKRTMTPAERAQTKIAELEYKLERERFRLAWLQQNAA